MNPEKIYRSFLAETKDHRIAVENDNGVHRSVVFAAPLTGIFYFRLNTWPGHLAISGDISDGLIFTRHHDMFQFFRADKAPDDIDFRYWAEKLTASSMSVCEFDLEKANADIDQEVQYFLESHVLSAEDTIDLKLEVSELSQDVDGSILFERLYNYYFYDVNGVGYPVFTDIEPSSWYDYNYRFYLNCFAIQAGIQAYNRYKSGGEDEWLHPESLLQAHGITRTPQSSE